MGTPKVKFQSLKLESAQVKNFTKKLLVSTELVDNQVMDKIFVGKVNVMPLEAIDQKIEEFRTLRGDELKQAIIAFANQTTHVE